MDKVLCHIIGLDEIHKNHIVKKFNSKICFIDLDTIQQHVYYHPEIQEQKDIWEKISRDIVIKTKQKKLIGTTNKKIKLDSISKQIKKLSDKRNDVKKNIHKMWKNKMTKIIDKKLKNNTNYIIFLGINLFPKDYRIYVKLPDILSKTNTLSKTNNTKNNMNKLIYSIKSSNYAANQIKFYLKTYQDKIINGTFPVDFLKTEYLISKYEKIIDFYCSCEYVLVDKDDMICTIDKIIKKYDNMSNLSNKIVYVATLYKCGNFIPSRSKTPIIGHLDKKDAINMIRTKNKKNIPFYLYEVSANQFQPINGELVANNHIYPKNVEQILLTDM